MDNSSSNQAPASNPPNQNTVRHINFNKAKTNRIFKRNLFYSKLALQGLSLTSLGKRLSPPVCKVRVFEIVHSGAPAHRLKEIAAILKTNVQTLWPKEEGGDA